MLKTEVILERLDALDEYLDFLRGYQGLSYGEFRQDRTIRLAVERALHLSIQCIIDIASHILAATSHRRPADYGEAILLLAEEGVIPPAYAGKIVGMAQFRNILVHNYIDIDPQRVYQNWQEHLEDFHLFSQYINEYLQRAGLV